jgi:hypothetical protein
MSSIWWSKTNCGQCAGVLTMRLIQFREPGPPAVMQCLDVPIPEPASGEVLIRAHAIGVGMPDCLIRAGTYSVMPPLPATPGTELAGVIEKVGPSVTTRREGQRVYTTARERPHRGGHYAEYGRARLSRKYRDACPLRDTAHLRCAWWKSATRSSANAAPPQELAGGSTIHDPYVGSSRRRAPRRHARPCRYARGRKAPSAHTRSFTP